MVPRLVSDGVPVAGAGTEPGDEVGRLGSVEEGTESASARGPNRLKDGKGRIAGRMDYEAEQGGR